MTTRNYINSSPEASVLEQICRDERVDDVWFLNFFSTVTYSASKKVLQFIPLR